MKHILILSFSSLQHDARVSRQIEFLKKTYQVTAAAFDGISDPEVNLIKIQRPRLTWVRKAILSVFLILRIHSVAYALLHGHRQLKERLAGHFFDLVIANDIESLPLAFDLASNGQVLFDAHEYAPRHFEDRLSWRIFFQPFNIYLCRKFIPRVACMTTVGTGLANEYLRNFSVKPEIITNATWYKQIEPTPVDPVKIRMIHHGGATISRRLELMIELMQYMDNRFTLDLMLIVPELASSKTRNYIRQLQDAAAGDPRIRFLPPLKSDQIVAFINQYDLGLFLLPPVNFNYANTLPNKLYDFIQARLGIVIGPTPEMALIVNKYKNGIVSSDFTPKSLSVRLNQLTTAEIQEFKLNSAKAARDLTAEANQTRLLELVNQLLHSK